jgi:5-formyltetrahydrofolate cyclo-ligase
VAVLRAIIERERRARTRRACRAAAVGLRDVLLEAHLVRSASCVALYVSRPDEPGTYPLRLALRRAGVPVLLPTLDDREGGSWMLDDLGEVLPGRARGQSKACRSVAEAGLIVVPALAVDTLGHRLGRAKGAGSAALREADPMAPVMAAVFDTELYDAAVETVPVEPGGMSVLQVLTPSRIVTLTDGR